MLVSGDRREVICAAGELRVPGRHNVSNVLAAAIVGTIAMLRTGAPRINWLIPGFGFLGFLDEMRLGSTFLPFAPPVIDGIEVDSLHDVLVVGDRFLADLGVTRIQVVLAMGLVIAVAIVLLLWKAGLRSVPTWLAAHRPLTIAAGGAALVLVGLWLDQIGTTRTMRFAEETTEFAAAGLVLVAATALLTERRNP